MKTKTFITAFFSMLLPLSIHAHEYWFEPDTFFPEPNTKTPVHLYVGDGLIKDRQERPYQPLMTRMFAIHTSNSSTDLKHLLTDGALPITEFSPTQNGNYLLAMERDWASVTLEAQKFEDYLRTDGLDEIVIERAKRGESAKQGREKYSRFIKSLLMVGQSPDNTYAKTLGLKLEITPLENPYSKKIGDTLKFKVMFDGKPLIGKTVFADNRDSTTQKMTTDNKGELSMKIAHQGLWLIRLVHMQRCQTNCETADWESYWGAFTFGVR